VTQLSEVLQARNGSVVLRADIEGKCAFGQHEDVLRNASAVECMLTATLKLGLN